MSRRSPRPDVRSKPLQATPEMCPFPGFAPPASDNIATPLRTDADHSRHQEKVEDSPEIAAARVRLPSRIRNAQSDTHLGDDTAHSHHAYFDDYRVPPSLHDPQEGPEVDRRNTDHLFPNRYGTADTFSSRAPTMDANPSHGMPPDKGLDPDSQALADYIIQGIRTIKAEGTNGWAEISNTLNDIDDEKLDHCKDDIDTLLVFAGLFSAVLTAFVIESYTALSPDPTSAMIQLLTQISVQTSSYTITPSFMNATSSVPVSFAFEASPTALRVNRLWFISLILSLITASFGILIKQWLREYKAVDVKHANLRSRLRIRQFRYPGLTKWKVFEIAALLPLFMQAALGLFLLGLCFFTWDVNSGLGQASTVLVSAWIFFFIAAALAPVVSSDCPYKLNLLAPVLRVLRAQLPRFWSLKWMYIGPEAYSYQPWQFDRITVQWVVMVVGVAVKCVLYLLGIFCCCCSSRPLTPESVFESARNDMGLTLRGVPLEEAEVAKDERKELAILTSVDEVLLDDELLGTGMRSIIAHTQFKPEEVMEFLAQVLQHRLPQLQEVMRTVTVEGFPVTNLRPLSSRAWQGLRSIIYDILQQHAYKDQDHPASTLWINDALAILASRVDDRTVTMWSSSLAPLFPRYSFNLQAVSPGTFSGVLFKDIWAHFHRLLPADRFEDPMEVVCSIHRGQYCDLQCRHESLLDQARSHCPFWADQKVINGIVIRLLAKAAAQGRRPSESVVQLLCAAVSWAACRCHHFYNDTPRKVFLMRLISLLQHGDGAFVNHLMSGPLPNELALLWHSETLEYRVDDPNDRAILGAFNFAVAPFRTPDHGPIAFRYTHPIEAYFEGFYKQTLFYYASETGTELPKQEEWIALLHLTGDILRYGLRVPERSHDAHSERMYASISASDALTNHWSPPQVMLHRHPALLPYWIHIIEALHLYLRPEATPFRGQPGPHCRRGATKAKFRKKTLDVMASHGWNVVSRKGTGSTIREHSEPRSQCPVVENRLAALLGTIDGVERRTSIEAGGCESEQKGEETETSSGNVEDGVFGRSLATLRALWPVWRTGSDSNSFTGVGEDSRSAVPEVRVSAGCQRRTCVQLDAQSSS